MRKLFTNPLAVKYEDSLGVAMLKGATEGYIQTVLVGAVGLGVGIEVTPDGNYLYTGIMGGQDMLVLDPFTGDEITSINIGDNLHGSWY